MPTIFHVDWFSYLPALVEATLVTLAFTVVSFAGAASLGLLVAVARLSSSRPLRWAAQIYTELFKNVPPLTPIFILYFGLASMGLVLTTFEAGCCALILFYGSYLSEIFRGALLGVPLHQHEAAQALGLRPSRVTLYVVLPQALRLALPGAGTMLVDLLKATSLLVTISASELMTEGTLITSITFRAFEVYLVIGAIYFCLCFPLSRGVLALEGAVRRGMPISPRRRRLHRTVSNFSVS